MGFARRYKRADKAYLNINQDRDGGISRGELQKYFGGFGAPAEVSDYFYDKMDKNNDGNVDLEEFKRVIAPLIHQEDESGRFGCRSPTKGAQSRTDAKQEARARPPDPPKPETGGPTQQPP